MLDHNYLNALDDALCANDGIDPNLFFDKQNEYEAVKVCAECPIIAACAEYALKNKMTDGVWGGLTPEQRKKLWKKHLR